MMMIIIMMMLNYITYWKDCTNKISDVTHLQYLTPVGHAAIVVQARPVHPQGHAVQQNHQHADSLEPREV
jgi:hypothetical protein